MDNTQEQSVLVIDDSEDIHHLVSVRLRSEDVRLLHAHGARQGMTIAREAVPDLILLDIDMPETNGLSVCRELKAEERLKDIPVIFLTGTMDTETKVQAFDLGAVDYVTKPFDAVELKARVRAALRTKRYHDLLTTKAQIDALTGLWNRGHFNDQLSSAMAVTQRHGHPLSLKLLDIDHFKFVNDNYGHPFGDSVIKRIGGVLNAISRESDVVCRYGGEEFIVLLPHTDTEGAGMIAERARRQIEAEDFSTGREQVRITASFGVAGSDTFAKDAGLTGEALLGAADEALYRAKSSGRNRVASSS